MVAMLKANKQRQTRGTIPDDSCAQNNIRLTINEVYDAPINDLLACWVLTNDNIKAIENTAIKINIPTSPSNSSVFTFWINDNCEVEFSTIFDKLYGCGMVILFSRLKPEKQVY